MSYYPASRRSWIFITVGLALLALAIWQIGRVRPPSSFRIATGPEGSQSHRTAQSWVDPVAERGFRLEVVPTRGSVDVADQMQRGEVEAGLLDNTLALEYDFSGIEALAAVFPEPLWIFYPAYADSVDTYDALADLSGRISIGEPNSGTNGLARLFFELSEVGSDQVSFVSLPDDVAADQLLSGDLDAAIIVGGIDTDAVIRLLTSPDIELLNLSRIDALTLVMPFLDAAVLPEGAVRLRQNLPDEDKNLLATRSVLAARTDLHPDLQRLLLTAAGLDRRSPGWFAAPGEYPTTEHVLLDTSPVAVDFFEGAPTYLERYLPFWIASPIERFYLLILPLIVLIYPLVRSSPAVYGGFMRRRINRWYKSIREVELGMEDYSLDELTEHIERLSHLSVELAHAINVPTGYMERYYNLRLHIRLVLDDLRDRRQELLGQATDQAQ